MEWYAQKQPYDESMTPAVIIDDLKKRLQAKELERQRQLKANADSWNKLDAHQEQMLLRRCELRSEMWLLKTCIVLYCS